jgi:hypothetical protein
MPFAIEGLGTTLVIGSASLCYVSIQALGIEGGEKLDATCLDNTGWMTYLPQTLKDVPNLSFRAKFDPSEWQDVVAQINVNQALVINFDSPYGALTFWGFLKSFLPEEGAIGAAWEATGEIAVTNMNASNVETAPAYAS